MSKNLTPLSLAAVFALSTGCVIVSGGTASDSESSATEATASTSTSGTGTDGTSGTGTGTATEGTGTGTATESGSESITGTGTDSTTVSETTTETDSGTGTDSTGSGTDTDTDGTGTDTDGALPCGWNPRENYYACELGGGEPGAEDPMMLAPYACPDRLEAGADCGSVDNLGCCDDDGNLWYCADGLVSEICR